MKTIIKRFALVVFGITAVQGIIAPVLYLMILDKGISIMELGLLLAILTFVGLVLEVPFGSLADNFGRKRTFLIGETVLLIAVAGFWYADTFAQLAVVMALNGAGTALISGTLDALFVEKHAAEIEKAGVGINLQQSQALYGSFQAIGLAAGGSIAGFIPLWFRSVTDSSTGIGYYEINVLILIPFLLIHFLITALIIPESSIGGSGTSIRRMVADIWPLVNDSVLILRKNRIILILLVGTFLGGVAAISIEQHWQPRFAEIIDARSSTWIFGLIFTTNFLLVAVGQVISIPLSRLFGHNYCWMLVALEGLVALFLFTFSFQYTIAGFLICFMMVSLIGGATVSPFMAMFHEHVKENVRSTMLSVKSMFMQGGIMTGALIAGMLAAKFDIQTSWRLSSLILLLSISIYILPSLRKTAKRRAILEQKG